MFDDPGVAHLRRAVAQGRAEVWIDEACLAELARVLTYPLRRTGLEPDVQAVHIRTATSVARLLDRRQAPCPSAPLPLCRDADDQKFLELARDCVAHALITRDMELLELARRKQRSVPFHILCPAGLAF